MDEEDDNRDIRISNVWIALGFVVLIVIGKLFLGLINPSRLTIAVPTPPPHNYEVMSHTNFERQLRICNLRLPIEERIRGDVDYVIDRVSGIRGELTKVSWFNEPPYMIISGIQLINFPANVPSSHVCALTNKAYAHVEAADWVIQQVEILVGSSFGEVLFDQEGEVRQAAFEAISIATDYYALFFLTADEQKTLIQIELGEPKLSQFDVNEMERLGHVGYIIDSSTAWWHRPEIWNQLPE